MKHRVNLLIALHLLTLDTMLILVTYFTTFNRTHINIIGIATAYPAKMVFYIVIYRKKGHPLTWNIY